MSIDLKRIRIERLFDAYNLDVPIQDNTLILVGENGSGKSTVINLLYYTLTAQWDRLAEVPFHSCTVTIGDQDYPMSKEDLCIVKENNRVKRINNFYSSFIRLGTSSRADLEEDKEIRITDKLAEYIQSNLEEEQVLFLPTYRRIEKELRDVFPDRDFEDVFPVSPANRSQKKPQAGYVELVEFGMEDVIRAFDSTLSDLEQNFRQELNRLTGSYLGDIIRNTYKNVEASQLATEEFTETIKVMLPRIGDILSEGDRQKLGQILEDVRTNQVLLEEQRVTAYFLTRLVEIHKSQQEKERPIRKLVDLVNQYLSNKKLEFNSSEFKLVVKRKNKEMTEVPIPGLSSGEKQIISLFSHILLSDHSKYFVVIDEPELSISVPWQRRFLQDLKDTEKCSGLIAVTHSPFVFENSLAEYAHSISEFIEEI
ncbi:ATP/GTP-binding protein [Limnospira fusiformis CCALA 023]|uniref:AAA family ATPase n=1 Tax=Limnospira platensis TaxID=118562 RepID=UPI00396D8D51